jgi:hypothetical protein
VNTYEQVLRVVAKDRVALNAGGRWWYREPGESPEEALLRLRQRAWYSGQAMFAVQLGETSQVGSGGVVVTPQLPTISSPSPPSPIVQPPPMTPTTGGGPIVHSPSISPQLQPVIRQSIGAKTGVNLLGDLEKWALPDAQKVTKATLTLNTVSVKELRELCMKLPPKIQAELQLTLPPGGDTTK